MRTGRLGAGGEPLAREAMAQQTISNEGTPSALGFSLPAEWEPHEATWLGWPHNPSDWPGKLEAIPWVYAEIARVLSQYEQVEVLCHNEQVLEDARAGIESHRARSDSISS